MSRKSVLVVDDNTANRDLYVDLLEMTPYAVLALDSGLAALALVRQHHPGLILMDINLPGRSGLEIAGDIIAELGEQAPPILALTASCVPDLVARLQQIGFIGLVSKPCGIATFLEAVNWGMAERPQPFRIFSA